MVHTTDEFRPWVKIDLDAVYVINTVVVANRMDCCKVRGHCLVKHFLCSMKRADTDAYVLRRETYPRNLFKAVSPQFELHPS